MSVRLNEDEKIVRMIKEGLKEKNGYCPCRRDMIPENKCMCKEFRDQIADPDFEGYCHCMLYYKSKDEKPEGLKVGDLFHGFKVDRVREDKKAGGLFIEMTHEKTGARLCYSKNSEENKLFSVAFKTIPEDSTGVFHILEHSVLCGSDKYPVKEPFVELMKSSMNTFLNAITFPDKTVYPVSSRNVRDFLNLTEVYLDAVFAPALLHNENIFLQEGRRLEVTDGVPSYNGVVLNEMRGATSEADDVIYENVSKLLFPDSCYRFNSGGDPSEIPELTYEKFVDTYRRFYHPSNSYIYLDGDIPVEETFSLIESYLDRYEREEITWDVARQTPVSSHAADFYAVDDMTSPRDIFVTGKILANYDEIEKGFALGILRDYLSSSNESPLKRAVLSSGLAEDLDIWLLDDMLQLSIVTIVRNMKESDADRIKNIISSTIEGIVKEGIPSEDLVACINKFEFSFRQMREPKGLERNLIALGSWLFGGDPMLYLDTDAVFEKLRGMIGTGSFERILSEAYLDDSTEVTLRLRASDTLATEIAKKEAEYASFVYSKMDPGAREEHAGKLEKFKKWQNTPDSEAAIATVPTLPISEVSPDPKDYPTEVGECLGSKILFHKIRTNGIVYFSMSAPLTQFSLEELSLMPVIASLFKQLPTSEHDVSSIQREIKTYIGELSFKCTSYGEPGQTENCMPFLTVSVSALEENFEKAKKIAAEVLTSTLFDDKNRIIEALKQVEEANRQMIVSSGHLTAIAAAKATLSSEGAVAEALCGSSMMKAVKRLNASFETEFDSFSELIRKVRSESLTRENLIISATAEEEHDFSSFVSSFGSGELLPEKASYVSPLNGNTSVKIPSQVSFAVKADSLGRCGDEFDGSYKVAAQIISLEYLWNEVRVRGGAYGAGMSVAPNGTLFCYSYRDPSPASSLSVYDGCAGFLENFASEKDNFDKYIISTIADASPLQTPKAEGDAADTLYITGVSYETRKKRREEMLATDKDDLLRFTAALRHMAADGTASVVISSSVDPIEGFEIVEI